MAETVKCACGEIYPSGTDFCTACWDRISPPEEPIEESNTEHDNNEAEIERCANCGMPLQSSSCPLCEAANPAPAFIALPNGIQIGLLPNTQTLFGRDTSGLSAFDVVSRRHCFLTYQPDNNSIQITDAESRNGTYVKCAASPSGTFDKLKPNTPQTFTIPFQLRLGKSEGAILTITNERKP